MNENLKCELCDKEIGTISAQEITEKARTGHICDECYQQRDIE